MKNVSISYAGAAARHTAVKSLQLSLARGEILGLVGESGCGKTTLAQAVVRLVDIDQGAITLDGKPLSQLRGNQLRAARKDLQMIFQDPFASLNPRMTVFEIIAEPLALHGLASGKAELNEQVLALMLEVGLDTQWANCYPHQFSGGQRQRVAIARAIAVEPKLLIADEPVSALDVTIQAQILQLLLDLCVQHEISMIFISHDLSVVRYVADRIAVMHHGRIVEMGATETVLQQPQHSYTQELLAARLD
ncbi:MAG: ABC transporter ATP-binding protein [Pseudomonadales bacterium]|nr:ABC transporter ATP-binding protein [Pseudomonadales bacterium]